MRGWLAALLAVTMIVGLLALVLVLLAIPVALMWQGGWWAMLGLLIWSLLHTISRLLQKVL
jgi:hypothetical protein